jgi:hypothetical protein
LIIIFWILDNIYPGIFILPTVDKQEKGMYHSLWKTISNSKYAAGIVSGKQDAGEGPALPY